MSNIIVGEDVARYIDLRHGEWQETILPNVDVFDCWIGDPPYTKRTKLGQRSGANFANGQRRSINRPTIPYAEVVEHHMVELVDFIVERCRFYAVIFNDHVGFRWLEDAFTAKGWFVAPPVPWIKTNAAPRMNAVDPDPDVEWICVARPKKKWPTKRKGNRDGYYMTQQVNGGQNIVTGQKPLGLMRQIVRDYTLVGDLVIDCYAGSGTTAIAAAQEGCRCITSELDDERFLAAKARIAKGWTVEAFPRGKQKTAKPMAMFDRAAYQTKEMISG